MKATLAIILLSGATLAQGLYPIPPIERIPNPVYVAAYEAEQRSNTLAGQAFSDMETNMLALVGTPALTNWQATIDASTALTKLATGLRRLQSIAKTNAVARMLLQNNLSTLQAQK